MSTALDAILSDYASDLEVTCEIDSAKRDDGTLKTWYFSTHIRATGASDTPANTTFLPFLMNGSIGPLSQSLSEDEMFSGLAANSPGSITLLQVGISPDELSPMNDYVFAGYPVRIKIGREGEDYDNFVTFRTTTVSIDPSVQTTGGGIEATFPLAGALTRTLEENLTVKRHVGIPHCLRSLTSTGGVVIPRVAAAHDLTRFTIMARVRAATSAGGNFTLLRKLISVTTDSNFRLLLTSAGEILFDNTSAGAVDVAITSSTSGSYDDGNWHAIIAAYDYTGGATGAYLAADRRLIAYDTPVGTPPNLSVTNPVFAVRPGGGDDIDIQDVRLYDRYIPFEEAISLYETRANGDELNLVGLWRCDDNTGGTVNDYSVTASDGVIGGVENTDYSWQASDLGEPELAGKPYPLAAGNVLNARAQLIDGVRERYRGNADSIGWHSSGSNTTIAVRSRGTLLTGGGVDYTTPSDGGDGVFSTTAQEDEPVTYDLLNNGTAEEFTYPATLTQSLLAERTRFEAGDFLNVNPLSLLCPWPSGTYVEQESTAGAVMQSLLGESGLNYREDADGKLWLDVLLPPTGYGPYGEPCLDLRGGKSNRVTWGDTGDITGSLTIAGWVKLQILDQTLYNWGGSEPNLGTMFILQKGGLAGNYSFWFQAAGSGAGKLKFKTAGTTLSSAAGWIANDGWFFVAATFDDTGNTNKIYAAPQDGTLIEIASGTNTGAQSTNSISIALGDSSESYPWMSVQYLQLWNTAKSLAELQALMATPPVGNEAGLVFYPPLTRDTIDLVSGTTGTISYAVGGPDGYEAQWAPKFLIDLDSTPSVTLSSFHHIHPAGEIIINYAKNRTPMTSADIDTGISQNDRITLTRQGLDVRFDSPDIRDRFPSAKRIILDSPILDQESAQRLLRMIRRRFGEDVYTGVLEFPSGLEISRLACGLEIGDEIGLTGTIPSQLQTPRSFRVVAVAPNPLTLSTSIVIFG